MKTLVDSGFVLPAELSATEPPEARGLARDQVRLLLATSDGLTHARFRDLPRFLQAGDLVVVNTSATLPAAVEASWEGRPVVVHFSAPTDDGTWIVELRIPDGSGPFLGARPGDVVKVPAGRLTLLSHPQDATDRLWLARAAIDGSVESYLNRHGRPIAYAYMDRRWPIESYQTVFGRAVGSAEMASAGRPFTHQMVTELVTRGVVVAPVQLHAGVSSLEKHEPPQQERFVVPEATARLVNHTRRRGGRVVAVGTTTTRALESMARPDGTVEPGRGWTDLVLGPQRPARTVTGLITGWHSPGASHLLLLQAVAGRRLVDEAYAEALDKRYLWHEFGDSALLLPGGAGPETWS